MTFIKKILQKLNIIPCNDGKDVLCLELRLTELEKTNDALMAKINYYESEGPRLLLSKEERELVKISKADEMEVKKLYAKYPKGLDVLLRFIEKKVNVYTEEYVQFQKEESNQRNKAYREMWRFLKR